MGGRMWQGGTDVTPFIPFLSNIKKTFSRHILYFTHSHGTFISIIRILVQILLKKIFGRGGRMWPKLLIFQICGTVDPVINDPATNDLLSPTTFFSCTDHFSIVNDLWSTTFCLTRLATSNIWQKVIILLVSNDLNFFCHTTFGNIQSWENHCMSDLTVWISWLTERYNAGRSGCCRKRSIYLRPSMLLHSNITPRR